jgi:hypothetical protein
MVLLVGSRGFAAVANEDLLKQYVSKELGARDKSTLAAFVSAHSRNSALAAPAEPYSVLLLRQETGTYYCVVGLDPSLGHPGSDTVSLHVFSRQQKLVAAGRFPTGHRLAVNSVEVARFPRSMSELVLVREQPVTFGPNPRKEYYALSGGSIRLVRLEDGAGQPVPNNCSWGIGPDLTKGIGPGGIGVRVERLLREGTPADRLAALQWLSAAVPPPAPCCREHSPAPRDALIVDQLRRLRSHPDTWTREAAALAYASIQGEQDAEPPSGSPGSSPY